MTKNRLAKNTEPPSFGNYIREARRNKFPDLTIREFAASIGITGPHQSKIELGKASPPSITVMMMLAHKLDIPLDFLKAISLGCDKISESPDIKIRDFEDPLPTSFFLPMPEGRPRIFKYQLSQSDILKYLGELFLEVSRLLEKGEIEEFSKLESVKDLLSTLLFDSNFYLIVARKTALRKMFITHNKKQSKDYQDMLLEEHKQAGGIEDESEKKTIPTSLLSNRTTR